MNVESLFSLTAGATRVPTTLARQLLDSWKDRNYRAQFVRERVQSSVALQVRALREQRDGMTQAQLAERMGKAQPWISQLENPDYGKMSVATLLDLAVAFDVDLEIKFRPFSRALYELSRQDPGYFEVPSFDEEMPELEQASTSGWSASSGKWNDLSRAAALLYPTLQGTPAYAAQAVASQVGPPGLPSDRYWPVGSTGTPSGRVVEMQGGKDKRRRGIKGMIKRAAA
jgi:transcriptional regulator with XRE-family HTH domain